MMKRTGLVAVIGAMVAGIFLLAVAAFSELGSPDGERLSRSYHLFRWEHTVCYACHAARAEAGTADQDRDRIALALPR